MSSEHYGRAYSSRQDYHQAQTEREAEALRRMNSQLQREASRLTSEVTSLQGDFQNAQSNIRQATLVQTKLEERQRELKSVQQQMEQRHKEFEAHTVRRQQELEYEIQSVEQHADKQIDDLRKETSNQITAMQSEVSTVRKEMNTGLDQVRNQVEQTRRHLDQRIEAVNVELEAERQRRIEKESSRASKAAGIVEWIGKQVAAVKDQDALGLTVEWTRTLQHIERTREVLNGSDKEMAMPLAETAFASYQTFYLETERRIGVIHGVAQHVQEIAAMLEAIALNEHFRMIFEQEAAQLESAIAWLRTRGKEWKERRQWTVFEVEREKVLSLANALLIHALELESIVPSTIKQLQSREQKLKEVGAAVAAIAGAADRFETGYANPNDVKSPRLLRAHIGTASVDTYLDLDGTYRIDAYGFNSHGQCAEAAERMGHKLAEKWQVTEQQIDANNRQASVIKLPASPESWQQVASDFAQVAGKVPNEFSKG